MYVEYTRVEDKNQLTEVKKPSYWMSWGGRINPGRDYVLFGYLSKGVRYDADKGFEAKGLPDELGWQSLLESRLYISKDGNDSGEYATTLEKALEWNQRFGCKLTYDKDGNPTHVDHPDWHSHSWLTTKEFEQAIKLSQKDKNSWGSVGIEYKALLAAMKSFEKTKKYEARVVFWFDN